jgi:hypothetical protein
MGVEVEGSLKCVSVMDEVCYCSLVCVIDRPVNHVYVFNSQWPSSQPQTLSINHIYSSLFNTHTELCNCTNKPLAVVVKLPIINHSTTLIHNNYHLHTMNHHITIFILSYTPPKAIYSTNVEEIKPESTTSLPFFGIRSFLRDPTHVDEEGLSRFAEWVVGKPT